MSNNDKQAQRRAVAAELQAKLEKDRAVHGVKIPAGTATVFITRQPRGWKVEATKMTGLDGAIPVQRVEEVFNTETVPARPWFPSPTRAVEAAMEWLHAETFGFTTVDLPEAPSASHS